MMPDIHRRGKWRGFTLIELLVVISIIGVLVGILLPVISRVRLAAKSAATSAELSAIAAAIQMYYGDFKAYPGPLANNQLGAATYTTPVYPVAYDPVANTTVQLKYTTGGSPTTFPQIGNITGSENLVLGLLGGLKIDTSTSPLTFSYDPTIIFPDNVNPAPLGPSSVNSAKPKRWAAYLQVRPGYLSLPNNSINNGQFTDSANRPANDSVIPEFVDQFSEPMPILYLRANVGGTAVVGIGGSSVAKGAQLTDSVTSQPVIPQYDLAQIIGYTGSKIGTKANSPVLNQHGLQGLGNQAFGASGTADTITSAFPNNACVYFKDPNVTYDPTNNPNLSNTHGATARQKDGFILISPGPDGVYGTADDIIYPGSLNQ